MLTITDQAGPDHAIPDHKRLGNAGKPNPYHRRPEKDRPRPGRPIPDHGRNAPVRRCGKFCAPLVGLAISSLVGSVLFCSCLAWSSFGSFGPVWSGRPMLAITDQSRPVHSRKCLSIFQHPKYCSIPILAVMVASHHVLLVANNCHLL